MSCLRACLDAMLMTMKMIWGLMSLDAGVDVLGTNCNELPQSCWYPNLSEGADSVGHGQLRGDKECPFSGVTKPGRVLEEGAGKRCWECAPPPGGGGGGGMGGEGGEGPSLAAPCPPPPLNSPSLLEVLQLIVDDLQTVLIPRRS